MLLIFTPNSLANFLTFGDARASELSLKLLLLIFCLGVIGLILSSILTSDFGNGCSLLLIISFVFAASLDLLTSISKIFEPSEILSPTLTVTFTTLPFSVLGISTLDLSLSIVINGSFFSIDCPSETRTSITSTFLNSPIFVTFKSIKDMLCLQFGGHWLDWINFKLFHRLCGIF